MSGEACPPGSREDVPSPRVLAWPSLRSRAGESAPCLFLIQASVLLRVSEYSHARAGVRQEFWGRSSAHSKG